MSEGRGYVEVYVSLHVPDARVANEYTTAQQKIKKKSPTRDSARSNSRLGVLPNSRLGVLRDSRLERLGDPTLRPSARSLSECGTRSSSVLLGRTHVTLGAVETQARPRGVHYGPVSTRQAATAGAGVDESRAVGIMEAGHCVGDLQLLRAAPLDFGSCAETLRVWNQREIRQWRRMSASWMAAGSSLGRNSTSWSLRLS